MLCRRAFPSGYQAFNRLNTLFSPFPFLLKKCQDGNGGISSLLFIGPLFVPCYILRKGEEPFLLYPFLITKGKKDSLIPDQSSPSYRTPHLSEDCSEYNLLV